MTRTSLWQPLDEEVCDEIRHTFEELFPVAEHGTLAKDVYGYWMQMLQRVLEQKDGTIKKQDLHYDPRDPLSRVEQKTVLITYADSVSEGDEPTLGTLKRFVKQYFPALEGMHLLPACSIVPERFNDGYFSQVRRDAVHEQFGTDEDMRTLIHDNFSMADFVLNHVDIAHPLFQSYLAGDDAAGEAFYIFSRDEYRAREEAGDFAQIFRPRPFPLCTVFRRVPRDPSMQKRSLLERGECMQEQFIAAGLSRLDSALLSLLAIFHKLARDQMLLAEDAQVVETFHVWLAEQGIEPDNVFTVSTTQETCHTPYVFVPSIISVASLLQVLGVEAKDAQQYAETFAVHEEVVFGEEVYALTTFSHVQIDVNTSTQTGLQLLADDFAWYLSMDLNMIRLDAANFAFKQWGTSCFGLPEVKKLLKVLYLSMEAVAPRIVANLEVNNSLEAVLTQMSDTDAMPPMMYDFHLASMVPAVFVTGDVSILTRIQTEVAKYDVSKEQIRFSLVESHDGKSIRGGLGLLTDDERTTLIEHGVKQGAIVKSQDTPTGKQPYELCVATRSMFPPLNDTTLEVARYLTFYTLGFALMGRNVKAVYINDLLGLPNDRIRVDTTGEARDIKRTKSDLAVLVNTLADASTFEARVAKRMNALIALVDSEPALSPHGEEAEVVVLDQSVVLVHMQCDAHHAVAVVNVSGEAWEGSFEVAGYGLGPDLTDALAGDKVVVGADGFVSLSLTPFQSVWWSTSAALQN